MKIINEWLGGILRPMKDFANHLDQTEYEIGSATSWLLTRVAKGSLPGISDDQSGLLVEFVLQVDRYRGRLPIRLEREYRDGWMGTGTVLKDRHITVIYDNHFHYPRFIKLSGRGEDGRNNIVSLIFAKDAEELTSLFSSDREAKVAQMKYFPTTNMLVGIPGQAGRLHETYHMIDAAYTPRGHEPMHAWVRADTL